MPTVQAAPAQSYPVGETGLPSLAGQSFAQRTVDDASGSVPCDQLVDPNTALDFFVEVQQPDDTWVLAMSATARGAPGGPQNRNGPVGTLVCTGDWYAPLTVKAARIRVVVRDTVAGSGLATPVALGAVSLTWNLVGHVH